MKRTLFVLVPALLCAADLRSSAEKKAKPIQFDAEAVEWTPAPSTLPAGAKIAVLEGDPKWQGIFTMRLWLPAGARVAPHTHPREERVTVLSGSIQVAFGSDFDESKGRRFQAGGFYVNPPGVPHYVWSESDSILQITGIGPWKIDFVDAKPGAALMGTPLKK